MHFHVCVLDGVFEEVVDSTQADIQADFDDQAPFSTVSIVSTAFFHPAGESEQAAMTQVQVVALLWCAGTELTAQGGGCGHGGSRATSRPHTRRVPALVPTMW